MFVFNQVKLGKKVSDDCNCDKIQEAILELEEEEVAELPQPGKKKKSLKKINPKKIQSLKQVFEGLGLSNKLTANQNLGKEDVKSEGQDLEEEQKDEQIENQKLPNQQQKVVPLE